MLLYIAIITYNITYNMGNRDLPYTPEPEDRIIHMHISSLCYACMLCIMHEHQIQICIILASW